MRELPRALAIVDRDAERAHLLPTRRRCQQLLCCGLGPRRPDAEPHELEDVDVVDASASSTSAPRRAAPSREEAHRRPGRDDDLVAILRERIAERTGELPREVTNT